MFDTSLRFISSELLREVKFKKKKRQKGKLVEEGELNKN